MTNYIAFFDKESLMKLCRETGLSVYQIICEIEPASNLDKSGRAVSNQFTAPEERYIDFFNVRGTKDVPKEKLDAIKAAFDLVGIKVLCEGKDYSILDIYNSRLCKASYDQMSGWRRKSRELERGKNGVQGNE